jgi:protocatechuate 3,4-dioxygenase beta subunit
MSSSRLKPGRREVLRSITASAAGLASYGMLGIPGVFAEELSLTPRQAEGPFYPKTIPLDNDNDLIVVGDSITPAIGRITHLRGRLLDLTGEPIRNALIEIWQVDSNGVYQHTGNSRRSAKADKNFQGFGRFETGSTGEYYFRTIRPVSYPGRTPHIHFAVKLKAQDRWTTQCYVRGEPRNEHDWILNRIKDPKVRNSVIVDFMPLEGSAIGEFNARFDIVLGLTPKA